MNPKDRFPPICGTAMLSIERMRRLRATAERARIEVERVGDALEVRIAVTETALDGIALPAHVRVDVVSNPGAASTAHAVWVELRPGEPVVCRFPPRDDAARVVVRLIYADAMHDHVATVR